MWLDIDEKVLPLVKWLNSFESVYTNFSCQGGDPIVSFCCGDKDLKKILDLMEEYHQIICGAKGIIRVYIDDYYRPSIKNTIWEGIIPKKLMKKNPYYYTMTCESIKKADEFLEYVGLKKEKKNKLLNERISVTMNENFEKSFNKSFCEYLKTLRDRFV